MKQPILLIAIVGGAVSGALSALLTASLVGGAGAPAGPRDAEAAPPAAPDAELARELAALAERLDALDVRVQMLADRPEPAAAAARRPVDVPASAEETRLEEEMRQFVAAMRDPDGEVPEALWQGVNAALQDIRDQEERERDERRQARALERIDERLAELSSELGLDGRQADDLRDAWTGEMDRMSETFAAARESGDFFSVRDSVREIRRETNDAISLILTPEQYEQYQELSPGGAFGFGGRGGRGGFGGFGGPGDGPGSPGPP